MSSSQPHFVKPNRIEQLINRCYGWLASAGLGPAYGYLLTIPGRRTGTPHSVPVNVLRLEQRLYLVGTRGHTQWSRNAMVTKSARLKKGRIVMEFNLRQLTDAEKPEILKAYLNRFNWMVRRFFPLPSDSPLAAFAAVAQRYPVFELVRK